MLFSSFILACTACTALAAPLVARNNVNISMQNPELFSLHREMLNINSTSGYETGMVDYLEAYLKDKGLTVELQDVQNPMLDPSVRRQNVYAYIGSNRRCKGIIQSHSDTVSPWYPSRETNTEVFGRGANDAKGSVACQIIAFTDLMKKGVLKEGDVCLLYDVGEERYGDGIATFVESLDWTPKYILSGEPTESFQGSGHKGSINMVVNSTGVTAHSSVPDLGRNAIVQLLQFLPKLLKLEDDDFPYDDFHGNTTLSLNIINGGTLTNQVADRAVAIVNARVSKPAREIWNIITSKLGNTPYIELSRQSASADPLKMDVIKDWLPIKVMPYGTDLAGWTVKSLKFLLGVGSITTAHSAHEVVSKQEMLDMVDHYRDFMQGVLNGTLVPINNGTFPTKFELPESGGKTRRETAIERMQGREFTGCMH